MGLSALTRSVIPMPVRMAFRTTRFVMTTRMHGFQIPSEPHFDAESSDFFHHVVAHVTHYLEYGSGGSTVQAHRHARTLVSVDSDGRFLKDVGRKIRQDGSATRTNLIHANIGLTKAWGVPVFTKPTARRLKRWRGYVQAPWKYYREHGVQPDLILVDGRFRVACVLESLLNLTPQSECRILFDDYASRPHYSVVERFADLVCMKGRMAVFRRKPDMDVEACRQALEEHYTDHR